MQSEFISRCRSWLAISISLAFAINATLVLPASAEANLPGFSLPIAPIIGDDSSNSDAPDNLHPQSAGDSGTSGAASSSTGQSGGDSRLTIDEVKIEGNKLVSTEDIMGVVKTRPGHKFDRDVVMQDLKAINNLGYFDDRSLQVTPELSPKTGGVLLKIRVQENAPVTQFAFQGNQVLSSEEISKVFSSQLGLPQNLSHLSGAIDKVEQAYHERGFILARVNDVKDDPDGSIGLTISEGTIDKIEVVGNHKTKDFIVRNAIKIKPGSVYNEKILTANLRKLYSNGYFSDIRRSLVPSPNSPDKYTLKVEVDEKRTGSIGLGGGIDSLAGPFGSLSFSESNFQGKGQVLSFHAQTGMGMFSSVANSVNNGGQNFLPNQQTYNVEASFIEPNLLNTGTSMAVTGFGRDLPSYLVSQTMQHTLGTSVNFTHPLGNNFNATLGLTGQNTYLSNAGDVSTILSGMATRASQLGLASTTDGANALANSVRSNQLKGGTYTSFAPGISYNTTDAAIDPSKGTLAKISASPSLGLGSGSFLKTGASLSHYEALPSETTLATNIQGGAGLGAMPQFGQFNLGGFNGMRGYNQFSGLGTGTSMLMATAEVRRHIPGLHSSRNKIAKVIDKHVKFDLFCDAGQVGGNVLTNDLMSRAGMGAAIGFGLRLNVPMLGMVRVDYGFPLLAPVMGGYTPRLTFGFGERF